MGKSNIQTNPQACKECLACQLICSLAYTGAFNPEKSRIVIEPLETIRFTEDCVETCVLCAKHCAFGALQIVR